MIWINFNSVHRIEIRKERKEHLRSLLRLMQVVLVNLLKVLVLYKRPKRLKHERGFLTADVDENTGDDASDLEPEPTVPKASTTKKVAVPKTSKKRGPRGPYKKKIQQ